MMPILIESDKVCIDTNILIYSTFPDFDEKKHNNAMDALSQLTDTHNELYITNQILREFFAISTNKKIFDVPLTPVNAVKKMMEFANCMSFIYELDSTIETLTQLVLKYNVARQKIHDFNTIAVMLDNKIEHILTYNVRDFSSVDEVNVISIDFLAFCLFFLSAENQFLVRKQSIAPAIVRKQPLTITLKVKVLLKQKDSGCGCSRKRILI